MFVKLIEIGTSWCGPCRRQKDILKSYTKLPVEFIDADDQPELADKYEINDIPSIVGVREDNSYMVLFNHLATADEIDARLQEYK